MKNISCLRCSEEMRYIRREKLQLGETGWFLGDLPNLLAGAMKVDIYACKTCGKLEFFMAELKENELPQRACPKCGKKHDFDYHKCPFCKYEYYVK